MPFCASCLELIDKSNYRFCNICGEDGCARCVLDMEEVIEDPTELKWLQDKGIEGACPKCLTKKEIEFLKSLPLKQLPLYINVEWLYPEVRTVLLKLLKGESV